MLSDLEGVDTAAKQLDIALQKGDISPNENYTIEKFEVIRHIAANNTWYVGDIIVT